MTDQEKIDFLDNFESFMDEHDRLPSKEEVAQFGYTYHCILHNVGRIQTIANRIKNGWYELVFNRRVANVPRKNRRC